MKLKHILALVFIVLAMIAGCKAFGEVLNPDVGEPDRTVPVFEFDLIYFNPSTTNFMIGTEIELKASINNFTGITSTNPGAFAYWGDTLGTIMPGYLSTNNPTSDANLRVYYADYTNTDTRAVRVFINDGSMGYLTDKIGTKGYASKVIVIPSQANHLGRAYDWMRESNTNVVWCWRPRGAGDQGPFAGSAQLWFPCRPIEWRESPLNAQ